MNVSPTLSDSRFNSTKHVMVLRPISTSEMASHLDDFRKIQFDWALEQLCVDSKATGIAGQPMIMGMAGAVKKTIKPSWYSWRMQLGNFPPAAFDCLSLPCGTAKQQAENIPQLPVEDQIACVRHAAGDTIASLDAVMMNWRKHEYTHLVIEEDLRSSADVREFASRLWSRLLSEETAVKPRHPSTAESKTGDLNWMTRSVIIECFFLYLCDRGILLLPLRPKAFSGEPRGLDLRSLTPETRLLWQQYLDAHAATSKQSAGRVDADTRGSRERTWLIQLKTAFFTFVMMSNVRSDGETSKDIFDDVCKSLRDFGNAGPRVRNMRLLQRVLAGATSGKLVTTQNFARRGTMFSRFSWTNVDFTKEKESKPPEYVPHDYTPRQDILAWVKLFVADVEVLETKDINNCLTAYNTFLIWLAWSGKFAQPFDGLKREDVNDARLYSDSKCFRAFLINKKLDPRSVTNLLGRIAAFFDRSIDRHRLSISSPFAMRFDAVKSQSRRGKTPRMPLGRDMMEYIREFNARDDFAFSKQENSHYRVVTDPEDKRLTNIWFPAFAIIIDFMLRVPARSFQVRYIDSGEGDEFLPNFEGDLVYRRNEEALATAGRREFGLCIMQGLESIGILGLYLNTNKTSVDRLGGYEIPWCDDELRDNLLLMREWQMRYNRIDEPIPCIERHMEPKNRDVIEAIAKSFPLFRDPGEPGHHPPDRAVLRRYWDRLLCGVEDEINEKAGKKNIRLTELKNKNKGRDSSYTQRTALFDIHTLRVSGITALIEAGLPPDMVMSVVGHSTIVMTLYYNKISAARLNAALRRAMELASDRLDGGDIDERFEAFLVNSRSEAEDQAGLSMFKSARGGLGGGLVDFMSHGICPGGECETGGEWVSETTGFAPVPRPLACSLCRYRLTGPMFLPGLVLNANRLMHELRSKGEQIADLNERIQAASAGRGTNALKAQVSALYKDTDIISQEWAAEIVYVRKAEGMLDDFLHSEACANANDDVSDDVALPMLSSEARSDVVARLERKSGFALLQSLSDGVQDWVGFSPDRPLIDHREFLNEILNASDMRPFLLGLSGELRNAAANMLGRAITACVPDDQIESLRAGSVHLQDFPAVLEAITAIEERCRTLSIASEPTTLVVAA